MEPVKIKKKEKYIVKICANCFRQEYQNKLVENPDIDEAIYNMLEQRFKNAKDVELYIPEHKHNPGINVDAEAVVDDIIVPIRISYTICEKCKPQFGRSYNGILQLRNPSPEMLNFVQSEIDKSAKEGVYCVKKDEVDGKGFDYQITSAPFTRQLGKKLQNRFGGELKETARLITRSNTGDDLHRVTVFFRAPKFKKGDIVNYKGREVKVLGFTNKVFVQDIKTNKKEQASYDRIR